jgi:hypothetical protein
MARYKMFKTQWLLKFKKIQRQFLIFNSTFKVEIDHIQGTHVILQFPQILSLSK